MSVKCTDFIEEAERALASGSANEITYRNVVSRAYYGMYHCALGYADTLLVPPLSACAGGSHKKVSDYYKVGLAKTREDTVRFRKVGFGLLQIHSQRIRADYKLGENVAEQDATGVLQSTRTIVDVLVTLGAAA